MVMRVMLIGLLVTGAVAMLETDVSAYCRPCGNWCCCRLPNDLKMLLAELKKHESKQLLIVGNTADAMSPETLKMREELIEYGVPREIIGELILEGHTPLARTREGRLVMVENPK